MKRDFFKTILSKFVQYFFVGALCALVNWSVFYILNVKFNVYYLFATPPSYITGTLLNFILSRRVFKSRENRKKRTELVMMIISDIIGLSIDSAVTALCVEIFGFPNMVSKIIGTGGSFVFNFTSRQFFIFSHKHEQLTIGKVDKK
jgi:putative flippase GtrA